MSKTILLYNDKKRENAALRHSLDGFCQKNGVTLFEVTGKEICDDILKDYPQDSLLIMPGGEAKYYSGQLGFAGNQKIKDFVSRGGAYFGICAGAYYACEDIVWYDKLTEEIIDTHREQDAWQKPLGFLPVTAKGPVYQFPRDIAKKPNSYFTLVKSRMVLPGQRPFDSVAVYNGGPGFEDVISLVDRDDRVAILAGMANGKDIVMPAVIEKQVGQGRVIATSLHFEVAAKHLIGENPIYKPLQGSTRPHMNYFGNILKKYDEQRQNAWDMLLSYALYGAKNDIKASHKQYTHA